MNLATIIIGGLLPVPTDNLKHGRSQPPIQRKNFSREMMVEMASQIVQQQWPNRNARDLIVRKQARTLIRAHLQMIRAWQSEVPQRLHWS